MDVMHLRQIVDSGRALLLRRARKYRARIEERRRPIVLENRGHCPICERETTFVARDPWLRDHYKCKRCRSIPRERALIHVLEQTFPHWRQLAIHESSPGNHASKLLARQCRGYVSSHFFPDRKPGYVVEGIRCENLERLTFADESFDLHITQDVFEHVFDPARAFAEIARTLKPGGAHVFTVPLVRKQQQTATRATMTAAGEISYLQSPEYHRNPIDPKGSLVTMDWGYDICDFIRSACGRDTEIICLDDVNLGIRAEYIEVLVTRK